MKTPATVTGHKLQSYNKCLGGHCPCGGRVGGSGMEAGLCLPAKMPKREQWLQTLLGADRKKWPEELLRPPGKKSEGGLGNVRVAKAHFEKDGVLVGLKATASCATGKVRLSAAGTSATPSAPLADVTNTVRQQQKPARALSDDRPVVP